MPFAGRRVLVDDAHVGQILDRAHQVLRPVGGVALDDDQLAIDAIHDRFVDPLERLEKRLRFIEDRHDDRELGPRPRLGHSRTQLEQTAGNLDRPPQQSAEQSRQPW